MATAQARAKTRQAKAAPAKAAPAKKAVKSTTKLTAKPAGKRAAKSRPKAAAKAAPPQPGGSPVVPRYLEELQALGGLTGTDIANIADVSKATVSRWKQGTIKPHSRTQLLLSDLHYLVGRLGEYYAPEEARAWLFARHPQLEGRRAIDLVCRDRAEEVLAILERLDAEAYL